MEKETITITKEIVLTLIPIATFVLALITVNKWKKEYKAKVYFDCSFKLMKAVYSLRTQFMSMRSMFIAAWETLPKTEENKNNYAREDALHVLNKRNKPFQEALNDFYSIFPEVEILLGKDVINVCWDINRVVGEYNMAVNEYIQLIGVTNNYEHFATISSKVFSNSTPDELKNKFDDSIRKIELVVSKHLKM